MFFRTGIILSISCTAFAFEFPRFSWDTLPVAFHGSNTSGMYSEASLQVLAKFATVTIEKYQSLKNLMSHGHTWTTCEEGPMGENLTLCGCCEEDEIVSVARRVKALNPDTQVLAYLHTKIAHPTYRFAHDLAERSDLWLRNASGDIYRDGASSSWFCVDHGQHEATRLWEAAALRVFQTGVIDGLFMDGCARTPGPLAPGEKEKYTAGKSATMARLQAAAPGPLVCGSNGALASGVAATQIQNWGRNGHWSQTIPILQKAVAAGAMFQAHGPCPDDLSDAVVVNNLASFLIAAGPYSYYMCGGWADSRPTWYPVYDFPLGEPLANATLVDGIYHREFASGTVVTFDSSTETGHIQWAHTGLIV